MAKNSTPEIPSLFDDLSDKASQEQIAKIQLQHWRQHFMRLGVLEKTIENLMDNAIKEALRTGKKLTADDIGRIYQSNPTLRNDLDKAMTKLTEDMTASIKQGSKEAWLRANAANDAIIAAMAAKNSQLAALFAAEQNKPQNDRALRAFQRREVQGMNLSERVWKTTQGMKLDMERAIEVALAEGVPAQKLSQRVRQLLREPNRLYRRVRDKNGNLVLSQAAQKYHPGTGVYRSSYKNAMRVARTEVNMAYHASDNERWKNSWWVRGIRIWLSNNHTIKDSKGNPTPLVDICDDLKGDYPPDFHFTGWHPQCRCIATPLTVDYATIRDYYRRKRAGEDMTGYTPPGLVTEPPAGFKQWLADNQERLTSAAERGTTPYFIRENTKYTNPNYRHGAQDAPVPNIATPKPRKPTPLEIANDRHAQRTAENVAKIQRKWDTRQIDNLWRAFADGILPKETEATLVRLSEMLGKGKFEEFNETAHPLIVSATRHRNRTKEDAMRIQQTWDTNRGKILYEREYEALLQFKTRDWNYRWYLSQAKMAYERREYDRVKQFIDAAKYEKRSAEQKSAAKIAEKKATIYKTPTAEEYSAAMERNKNLGVFTCKQDANNRKLELAMGVKQGDVMDWETADSDNANPGHKRKTANADGYLHNCQTCTMTYEARRRGFKIIAAPSPGKKGVDPNNFYTFAKKNGLTWRERFLNEDGTIPTPTTSKYAAVDDTRTAKVKFIEDNTTTEGRYEIFCAWKSRNAHVFIVEREKDGELRWIDPQTGKSGTTVLGYAESMKPDKIEILRIDNKIINPRFASRMIKKTK